MSTELSVPVLLVHLVTLVSCQNQGEIRLTGWTDGSGGRLEVFLNGKWGTVSGQTGPRDDNLHLGFGKTVCYQINHYNGDDSSIFTGTVSSLNKYLQKTPGNALIKTNVSVEVMYDLNCTNKEGKSPRHILRCSYKIPKGNANHGEDLAVLCPQNASNYDNPHPGQFRLVSDRFDPSYGTAYVYAGHSWKLISYDTIYEESSKLCNELGYTHESGGGSSSNSFLYEYVNLPPMHCSDTDYCLLQCFSKNDADELLTNNVDVHYSTVDTFQLNCGFDLHYKDITYSPYVGDDCKGPYRRIGTSNTATIATAISVSAVIAVCIAIATTVTLICYFNKNCFLYRQRKKTTYDKI